MEFLNKSNLSEEDLFEIDIAFKKKLAESVLEETENIKQEYERKIEEIERENFEKLSSVISESSEILANSVKEQVASMVDAYFQEHREAFENEENVKKINQMMEAFQAMVAAGKDTFKKIEEGEFDLDEDELDDDYPSLPEMKESKQSLEAIKELNELRKQKIISEMAEGMNAYQKTQFEEICEGITYISSVENSFRQQAETAKRIIVGNGSLFESQQVKPLNNQLVEKYEHLI